MLRSSTVRRSLAFFCLLAACHSPSGEALTGLQGVVTIGPVVPGCSSNCETSVQATFTVERDARVVGTFRSDTRGMYTVSLAPGTYSIRPVSGGPIPFPEVQVKQVRVLPRSGLTARDLSFSTGLR